MALHGGEGLFGERSICKRPYRVVHRIFNPLQAASVLVECEMLTRTRHLPLEPCVHRIVYFSPPSIGALVVMWDVREAAIGRRSHLDSHSRRLVAKSGRVSSSDQGPLLARAFSNL